MALPLGNERHDIMHLAREGSYEDAGVLQLTLNLVRSFALSKCCAMSSNSSLLGAGRGSGPLPVCSQSPRIRRSRLATQAKDQRIDLQRCEG